MKKIDSLRKIGRLGNFLRLAVAPWLVLGPATPAMAWGDHKQKVLVPVVPVYTAPASSAAMAPVVSYSYGTGAGAPVAMAPGSGVISGVYYAPTAGTQFGMASATYAYPNTVSAPQLINPGASFAPTASTSFGNVPVKIGDSRVTDEGRKDVLADLKDYYQESKTSEKSRTTLRKALKDQAKEKYVEVIGGEVASVDDLKDSEKKEIDQIVQHRHAGRLAIECLIPTWVSQPLPLPVCVRQWICASTDVLLLCLSGRSGRASASSLSS